MTLIYGGKNMKLGKKLKKICDKYITEKVKVKPKNIEKISYQPWIAKSSINKDWTGFLYK